MELVLPKSHWKDTILGLLSISTGDHRWNIRWPPVELSVDHRLPPQYLPMTSQLSTAGDFGWKFFLTPKKFTKLNDWHALIVGWKTWVRVSSF